MRSLLLLAILVGAEHGIITNCPATATRIEFDRLALSGVWYTVAKIPCDDSDPDPVRFDVAKTFVRDVFAGQSRTYRARAVNAAGSSAPTPAIALTYPGGVWVIR